MNPRRLPWIKLLLALGIGVLALLFLSSIGDVVKLVLVSALLAYLLDPLPRHLESQGLSRTTATTSVFVALLAVLAGVLVYLLPSFSGQLQAMQASVSSGRAAAALGSLERQLVEHLSFLGVEELNLMETMRQFIDRQVQNLLNIIPGLFSLLGNLVLIPFIVFFLLKDGRKMKKAFVSTIPNRYFEFTLNVLHKMDVQLGNYLRGQILDATIVGVLSIGALWMLGVDYYVPIGIFAGLANLVPYVGPAAGGIVAVCVSVVTTGGFDQSFSIIVAFIGIQIIDNALILPLAVARNVQLHPLFVLLVVIIGGKFFGVLGLLLAVPGAAVATVMVTETLDTLRRYRLT